jgi:hypothetical protein
MKVNSSAIVIAAMLECERAGLGGQHQRLEHPEGYKHWPVVLLVVRKTPAILIAVKGCDGQGKPPSTMVRSQGLGRVKIVGVPGQPVPKGENLCGADTLVRVPTRARY